MRALKWMTTSTHRKFWLSLSLAVMFGLGVYLLFGLSQAEALPAPMPTIPGFNLTCLGKDAATNPNWRQLDGSISARAVVCSFELVMYVEPYRHSTYP